MLDKRKKLEEITKILNTHTPEEPKKV